MTQPEFDTEVFKEAMQLLQQGGTEGMSGAFRILIDEAMKIERSETLGASPYERTDERRGYANGFKPKTLSTRVGTFPVRVPQVRGDVEFYPSALERGERSDRTLIAAIAEMYIQGVSTRKVTKVLEKLCGTNITSAQVSRATATLDVELQAWRDRELEETPYLILDALYEKVRIDGVIQSVAILVAVGVREDGKRSVLGTVCSTSEGEVHWREFLLSLKERGLKGVTFVTSDDHEGLKNAIKTVFLGASWQRCQTHLQRNASAYVPKVDMRGAVSADIRDIFDSPDLEEAERRLAVAVKKYEKSASRLSHWMEDNLRESFAVFALPKGHRKRMRTSNMLERMNKEIRRRTGVVGIFPNEASVLRLVTAVVAEISDEWEIGKIYLNMKEIGSTRTH